MESLKEATTFLTLLNRSMVPVSHHAQNSSNKYIKLLTLPLPHPGLFSTPAQPGNDLAFLNPPFLLPHPADGTRLTAPLNRKLRLADYNLAVIETRAMHSVTGWVFGKGGFS